jgi:uncharacterized membrane protein YphA (DoxX/SURF4 family)
VLLRTAIGWHFFYEGVHKISTTPDQRDSYAGRALAWILPTPHEKDKEIEMAFSAEGYLRNATGPLATHFRAMLPDVNSLAKLERDTGGLPLRLEKGWKSEMERFSNHFGFNSEQRAATEKELEAASARVNDWFLKTENAFRIKKYYRDLRHVLDIEESPESLPYERTLAYKQRLDVDKERRALVSEVDAFSQSLQTNWMKIVTKEQLAAHHELKPAWTQLDWINLSTMWGMVAVGLCLMLGLFTRLSALGAAAFLTMFYLSMPPWPGLPVGKGAEGHYLYVNKNLIEFLACMVIVSTPNGLWLGLDALLFGKRSRRNNVVEAEVQPSPTVAIPTNPKRR